MIVFQRLVLVLGLIYSSAAFSHDGGHGPKVTDQPVQGGTVMPVIDKKEADKGALATLVYKAELVRKEDGSASLFIYDTSMKPIAVDTLSKAAMAKIGPMKRTPKWKSEEIKLSYQDGAYRGKLPKIRIKPFYLDITLSDGKREFLTAFENLD